MADSSVFFTAQSAPPVAAGISGAKPIPQLQGLNFIDIILGRMLEQATAEAVKTVQAKDAKAAADQLLTSDNPALAKNPKLDIPSLLAATPEIAEEVAAFTNGAQNQISEVLALNQQACDDILKPLTGGITTAENIEKGSPRLMQALLIDSEEGKGGMPVQALFSKLKAILNKLEQLTSDPASPGLSVTNLTPEQITDLKDKIKAFLAKHTDETGQVVIAADAGTGDDEQEFAAIYLGLVKILQPQSLAEGLNLQGIIHGKLNGLTSDTHPLNNAPVGLPAPFAPDEETGDIDFKNILKDFSGKKGTADNTADAVLKTKNSAPDTTTVALPFAPAESAFFTPAIYDDFTAPLNPALPVTSAGTMASLVTQSASASMPHPATAMIAATIQKNAANGEMRSITLQLDPPELGRVEIRMNFDKNKALKATVLAEKPDTYSMLQRDSHVLQRALMDAGLDTDGSSLSFELADQGYNFDGGGRNGSDGYARGDSGAPEEIIASTMSWYVDEATGHMRYSIVA